LDQDISEVLPYVNTTLGGGDYVEDPPSLTLRVHGKLISLHAREIFVNALSDDAEADKILSWLKKEINEAWDTRSEIEPTFTPPPKPQMIEILKLLPRTNCGRCHEPTCMVFAVQAAQGIKGAEDCPELDVDSLRKLEAYLSEFQFEI
jgi:ArsR family metal-binding transcriptional regulator